MTWKFWRKPPPTPVPTPTPRREPKIRITPEMMARAKRKPTADLVNPFTVPKPPPGVLPENAPTMAQDDNILGAYNWASG